MGSGGGPVADEMLKGLHDRGVVTHWSLIGFVCGLKVKEVEEGYVVEC